MTITLKRNTQKFSYCVDIMLVEATIFKYSGHRINHWSKCVGHIKLTKTGKCSFFEEL